MKILYFSITDIKGPASRYRAFQYAKYFEQNKHDFTISHAFSNSYLDAERNEGIKRLVIKGYEGIKAFLRRIAGFRHVWKADMVAIEREFFPCFPPLFELIIKMLKGGYILEFDDAIFLSRGRRSKYPATVKMASRVIVGNPYLEEYAKKFNKNVVVVPTCVDAGTYQQKEDYGLTDPARIGWVGLAYNFVHLNTFASVLGKVCNEMNAELVICSSRKPAIGAPILFVKWDLAKEMEVIRSFDVGIMPLVDTPYSRGKCGLKLLQYMAAGVPVVASPVGVNKEIVEDGVNGFLAKDDEEWYEKVKILIGDEGLRRRLGQEGRRTVEKRYDLELYGDKLVSIYTGDIR